MSYSFDCVVDTSELAQSVNSVRKNVDTTTGAVVAMKAAVLKAEKDGSDYVCQKVNQGFYSMIHSQISQKMASLQSNVDAQLMRLNQQSKQLKAIRDRMERDYNMISVRYAKIFNALNRNLRQRVTELDRPVMNFATTEADKVANRSNQLVANVPVGQAESVKISQRIAASNLKSKAAHAIKVIESFIGDSKRLQNITDSILLRRRTDKPDRMMMMPVAVFESNYDSSDNMQTRIVQGDFDINSSAKSAVDSKISNDLRTGRLAWSDDTVIDPNVINYYRQLVAESGLDPRRQQTMLEMMDANVVLTFNN